MEELEKRYKHEEVLAMRLMEHNKDKHTKPLAEVLFKTKDVRSRALKSHMQDLNAGLFIQRPMVSINRRDSYRAVRLSGLRLQSYEGTVCNIFESYQRASRDLISASDRLNWVLVDIVLERNPDARVYDGSVTVVWKTDNDRIVLRFVYEISKEHCRVQLPTINKLYRLFPCILRLEKRGLHCSLYLFAFMEELFYVPCRVQFADLDIARIRDWNVSCGLDKHRVWYPYIGFEYETENH